LAAKAGVGHIQYNLNGALPAIKGPLILLICEECLNRKIDAFSSAGAESGTSLPEVPRCCVLVLCGSLHSAGLPCTLTCMLAPCFELQ
jgi:hypothetical protein